MIEMNNNSADAYHTLSFQHLSFRILPLSLLINYLTFLIVSTRDIGVLTITVKYFTVNKLHKNPIYSKCVQGVAIISLKWYMKHWQKHFFLKPAKSMFHESLRVDMCVWTYESQLFSSRFNGTTMNKVYEEKTHF